MNSATRSSAQIWATNFSRVAGVLVFLSGVLSLLGWSFGISTFTRIVPGLLPMVPNVAASFTLSGIALWLIHTERVNTRVRKITISVIACIIGLVAVLTLGEYLFGWHLGIDQFLFHEGIRKVGSATPGRPAFLAALNLLFISGSMLLLGKRSPVANWIIDLLVVIPLQISLLALIGYACNVPSFYGWRSVFPNSPMALHTAVAFAILCTGLLSARPECGLMRVLTSGTAGGVVGRRLLLAPVIIPLLTGLIRIAGRRAELYNEEFASWFFALLNIAAFTGAIWWIASLLHRTDMVRRQAEEEVRQLNAELEERVVDRTKELVKTTGELRLEMEERQRAETGLRAQLSRLDLLSRITRAISERQDLLSIFQVVVRSLEDNLPIDFGCFCLYDPSAGVLTVSCVGVRSEALSLEFASAERSRLEVDQDGLRRCVQGQLVYEPDVADVDFPFPRRLAAADLRSLVAAPLLVENQVIGVLLAARCQPGSFSSGECEFLRQLSEQVALAGHQTELLNALQRAYDELRQTQQAIMQQDRLRALGEMASGIAHDINNAISPVSLFTEALLEDEPNLSSRARDYLETIQRAIGDVAGTVGRMREFYRPTEPQLDLLPLQLNELVRQVLDLTSARWRNMPQERGILVHVATELADALPEISGVETEIREALVNLVFNAVDAMTNGGTITLRTRLMDAGSKNDGKVSPPQVCVEVIDTGVGMDEITRSRCLEPFYTTKGERGSGLGLSMVYGILQRHRGKIEIDSALGEGTTMRLIFPSLTADKSARPCARRKPAATIPTRLRILVVDDDPLLLKSLHDTLEGDGHLIVSANHGRAGIDEFLAAQSRAEPFDVVISDLGMPSVDGRQVASAIKGASPSTPILLLTGWGQRLLDDGDIPPHVDRVLGKPPKLRELREVLADLCQPVQVGTSPN